MVVRFGLVVKIWDGGEIWVGGEILPWWRRVCCHHQPLRKKSHHKLYLAHAVRDSPAKLAGGDRDSGEGVCR